jgi:hypothetical protein
MWKVRMETHVYLYVMFVTQCGVFMKLTATQYIFVDTCFTEFFPNRTRTVKDRENFSFTLLRIL